MGFKWKNKFIRFQMEQKNDIRFETKKWNVTSTKMNKIGIKKMMIKLENKKKIYVSNYKKKIENLV